MTNASLNNQNMYSNTDSLLSETSKSYRILLIEDDKVNQMLGKKMLSKSGYTVDVADDGQEAIALLKVNTYDLVITDIKTPNMDGYELTNYIRSSAETFCTIPIIAISAYPSSVEKQKAIAAGMNDYVSKPYGMAELVAAIAPFIGK